MSLELKDLVKDLIRIPSISSDIKQLHIIVDRVIQEFSEFQDLTILKLEHNDKPSLIISNTKEKWTDLCLNWHLDVVPASEENQFTPIEKDWKIYWRWSIDMKGPVSVLILLMKEVLRSDTNKKISLMLTCDEEVWWADWAKYLAREWYWADVMLTPDAPWLHKVVTAWKWIYTVNLEVPWKEAHSAYPWKWENAIENAYTMYHELKDTIEEKMELQESDHWGTSVQMTTINWWKAHNAIPWIVVITINIRHTESYSETLLKKLCLHVFSKYQATILSEKYWSLVFTPEENPTFLSYQDCFYEVTWKELLLEKMHGATDAQHFAQAWTISLLHWADGEHLHWKGEYVDIASLDILLQVSKKFILG